MENWTIISITEAEYNAHTGRKFPASRTIRDVLYCASCGHKDEGGYDLDPVFFEYYKCPERNTVYQEAYCEFCHEEQLKNEKKEEGA
jgi:hypothetical protein